jgi:hypothetical protein
VLSRTHRTPAEIVAAALAGYLGPHMARNAVKTFSVKALGRQPETLIHADIAPLLRALKPMLRTLLGAGQAEAVIDQLMKDTNA